MSASQRGSQDKKSAAAPGRSAGAWISGAVALIAVVCIIGYAVLHANRVVPGAAVATAAPTLPAPLQPGAKAPDFQLSSKIGTFSSAQLAGTPYLLELFATWCPHCQRMTQVLRAVRALVPESRLAMVSVTASPYASNSTPDNMVTENQADVDAFESQFSITWPTFFDPNLSVAQAFGLDGFPTIFVVNAHGTIVYQESGEVPAGVLLAAIRKAGA
ncbi:MAG TPA: TlpA disulfide reductase family protein [Candidatus Acidoferrales bacterium]|nr:TlpA disulfide reductase family protein [Candidatus Acidoferrales bacterium]